MYFDALTLAAVTEELRETILGGRIQRVLLTGPLSIGLEVYAHGRRHQLIASAHPQLARVHLMRTRLSRGVEQPTPLLLLMRKYLLGGRIEEIEQPPFERMLLLSIVKAFDIRNSGPEQDADDLQLDDDEEPPESSWSSPELLYSTLVIEPQDRRSNIILVDADNRILDSIKRVTPRMSSRIVLPRHLYASPPPLERRDPTRATAAEIADLAETGATDLGRALVATYRAVSPQIAREVIFRALGREQAKLNELLPAYTIAARLRELFTLPPTPCLVNDQGVPTAYAPYKLTHLAGVQAVEGMSDALEQFYAARETLTEHRQRRDALEQQLEATRARIQRQHEQIAGELVRAAELEQLRWEGEMIFAFMHSLQPGQSSLRIDGQTISLDLHRSPVEQAQERFRRYEKAKSAQAGLPERLAAIEMRLDGLAELRSMLRLSESYDQIEQIAAEAEELGYLHDHPEPRAARHKGRGPKLSPLQLVSSDGWMIVVGRSARQNEEVTFRIARPDDLWLHARNIPGAHVIVRSHGREPPPTTLAEAAGLAAYFCQAREDASVEIDICRRALVRKRPGGPPGLVTYQAERTLRAIPRRPW